MNSIINDIPNVNAFRVLNPKIIDEVNVTIMGKDYIIPIMPIPETRDMNDYFIATIVHMHLQMEDMRKEISELKTNKVSVPENEPSQLK